MFFLSEMIFAEYPAFFTAEIISFEEQFPSTFIEFVKRFTEHEQTPSTFETAFSTRETHAEQLIPETENFCIKPPCKQESLREKTVEKFYFKYNFCAVFSTLKTEIRIQFFLCSINRLAESNLSKHLLFERVNFSRLRSRTVSRLLDVCHAELDYASL